MRDKLFDDIAGMVGGAAGLLSDIREQVRGDVRDRLKNVADKIELVTRDDIQALEDRIAALEALLKPKQAAKPAKAKPAPKKAPARPAKKAKKAKK